MTDEHQAAAEWWYNTYLKEEIEAKYSKEVIIIIRSVVIERVASLRDDSLLLLYQLAQDGHSVLHNLRTVSRVH